MPAVYAHALFGRRVLRLLSGDCGRTVKRYEDYFMLGLQGPDILFFYRPFYHNRVVKTGLRIHHENAHKMAEHLAEMVKACGVDSAECAYAIGFICHYMLDTACHPLVDEEIERTGVDHISLETEFEKFLMRRNGLDPYTYDLRRLLPYDDNMPVHISRAYPGISSRQIREAALSMRAEKHFLTYGGRVRGGLKLTLVNMLFLKRLVYPHMIYPDKGLEKVYGGSRFNETGADGVEPVCMDGANKPVLDKEFESVYGNDGADESGGTTEIKHFCESMETLLVGSVHGTADIIMEFYRNQTVGSVFNMNFYGRK